MRIAPPLSPQLSIDSNLSTESSLPPLTPETTEIASPQQTVSPLDLSPPRNPVPKNPLSPVPSISSSSSDSSGPGPIRIMSHPNDKGFTTITQDSNRSAPIFSTGIITPENTRDFENACIGYFNNKGLKADEQVQKVLSGFRSPDVIDWISGDRDRLKGLTFVEFMKEFHLVYLDDMWEDNTRIELMAMSQGSSSFWDYAQRVQAKNALLNGTVSLFSKADLRKQIEAGANKKLILRVNHKQINKETDYRVWLHAMRRLDDILAVDRAELQTMISKSHETGRHDNVLTEPSRRANTSSNADSASLR